MSEILTNKEKAIVFSKYFTGSRDGGHNILIRSASDIFPEETGVMIGIGVGNNPNSILVTRNGNMTTNHPINSVRLILYSLGNITNEHIIVCAKLNGHFYEKDNHELLQRGRELIAVLISVSKIDCNIYHYLIQQRYAVPLFLGINHWANGKTAIELEIAIESKDMRFEKIKK